MSEQRYVCCLRCGYIVSLEVHKAFLVAVDCPVCGKKKEFGPGGSWVPEYQGVLIRDALEASKNKVWWYTNGPDAKPLAQTGSLC
jgi:hypothetical protein